jgi:hypothetical protein
MSSSPPVPENDPSHHSRPTSDDDERYLEQALDRVVSSESEREYMHGRFLPYVRFCESQARVWRLSFYWLRIPALVLATAVPALVAANLGLTGRLVATSLGVIVASLAAVEHFFNMGGRWRHYRSLVERLKSEGWTYVAHAPHHADAESREEALRLFVEQIERTIETDVGEYVTLVNPDTPRPGAGSGREAGS